MGFLIEQIGGLETRIDYIRYIIRHADARQALAEEEKLLGELNNEIANCMPPDTKQPYALGRIYDNQSKQSQRFIEVWGPIAHNFFWIIPRQRLQNISRIDVRVQTNWVDLDFGRLKLAASQCRYASKRRIQTIESPIRSKKAGRDAGGIGLSIGSHGSERRVSVYKRGKNEAYAVEVQFSKGMPFQFYQTACQTEQHYGYNVRHAYLGVLVSAFDSALSEYLGVDTTPFLQFGSETIADPLGLFNAAQEDPQIKEVHIDEIVTNIVTNGIHEIGDTVLEELFNLIGMEVSRRAELQEDWADYSVIEESIPQAFNAAQQPAQDGPAPSVEGPIPGPTVATAEPGKRKRSAEQATSDVADEQPAQAQGRKLSQGRKPKAK